MNILFNLFIFGTILSTVIAHGSLRNAKIDWSKVKSKDLIPNSLKYTKPKAEGLTIRVIGGKPARPHQFPYQVGLLLSESTEDYKWCGGTLITSNYVLTAAHCLINVTDALVFLGAHNCKTDHEVEQKRQYVEPDNFIIHPDFNIENVHNNIALIELPEEVELNENIQTIRIRKGLEKGERLIASGWGVTGEDDDEGPEKLQYVELEMEKIYACNRTYTQFGDLIIKRTNVCTKSKGGKKGTCKGDAGGPLVTESKNPDGEIQRFLLGIVSFGSKEGCESNYPSVYVKASAYIPWIKKHSDYKNK